MYKLDNMHLAAQRLLEMADRVLGSDAGRADRYAYINVLLSQWTDELDLTLRTRLRVSCYEQLFGADDEGTPAAKR